MKTITKDLLTACKMASKDDVRPAIACVSITEKRLIATDSYKMLIVNREDTGHDITDFPVIGDQNKPVETILEDNPILLNAKLLLKKMKFPNTKTALPIINTALLCNETKDSVCLATNDLESVTIQQFRKCEDQYPDVDQIIPTKETIKAEVNLDAQLLTELLNAFLDKKAGNKIKFTIHGENQPVIIQGLTDSNKNKKGVLMPIKS